MSGIFRYCFWAMRRRWRTNRAAYASVATVSALTFMSFALHKVSSQQLSALLGGVERSGPQIGGATSVLFGMGILVGILESQIVVARLLAERRSEFLLLSAIAGSRLAVVLAATVEYLGHVLIGAACGALGSVVLVFLARFESSSFDRLASRTWLGPIALSIAIPMLAILPITTMWTTKYTRVV